MSRLGSKQLLASMQRVASGTINASSAFVSLLSPTVWRRAGAILALLFVLIGIRRTVLDYYCVQGPSMEPTLHEGDCFLADKTAFINKHPFRGEVVILARSSDKEEHLIKRIIALPGDTLAMQAGGLYLNNKRLEESYADLFQGDFRNLTKLGSWHYSYLLPSLNRYRYEPTGSDWGPIVVAERSYFVLGDHRSNSMDSRHFGFIKHHELLARPLRDFD